MKGSLLPQIGCSPLTGLVWHGSISGVSYIRPPYLFKGRSQLFFRQETRLGGRNQPANGTEAQNSNSGWPKVRSRCKNSDTLTAAG